jgi:regulator of protease activity HflC (stomatin/prohibitin superfamily)
VNPGLHFVNPLAFVLRVDLRAQTMAVPSHVLTTKDGRAVTAEAELSFRVVDAARSTFQVKDYRAALSQETALALQGEARSNDLRTLLSDPFSVSARVATAVNVPAVAWGVKVETASLRLTEANAGSGFAVSRPLPADSPTAARTYDGSPSGRIGG